MLVTSKKGLVEKMPQNKFADEVNYQLVMHFCRKLLADDVFTADEYTKAEEIMCEKYKPVVGKLFSSKIVSNCR